MLFTHEIDSAYWHEWELFRLPGGIQVFVLVHIPLIIIFLVGFKRVILNETGAYLYSLVTAGLGVFAFIIHATFLALGYAQFRTPVSLALLACILIVSLLQGGLVLRALDTTSTTYIQS